MKKFAVIMLLMIGFAGISVAQTTPSKKAKTHKTEMKSSDSTSSSDTSAHKHWHKGMKQAKSKA